MMKTIRDKKRGGLILLAFFAGGAVPIQLVTLSFGYAQYYKQMSVGPQVIMTAHEFASFYIPWIYLPAMVLLVAVSLYSRRHYPDIFRRIIVGLGVGAIATLSLDAVREAGVIHGWLPSDMPTIFGKMATGSTSFSFYYPVGLLIHFMNGANFGLFYAFVWGKRTSYVSGALWGTVWLLIVELGMMTAPPMGPMVGLFGVRYAWPQLFLLTLVAHIFSGLTVGLLVQHFLRDEDRGGIIPFLTGLHIRSAQ